MKNDFSKPKAVIGWFTIRPCQQTNRKEITNYAQLVANRTSSHQLGTFYHCLQRA